MAAEAPAQANASALQRIGSWLGALLFAALLLLPAPSGLGDAAWSSAAVAVLMAVWWFTEAVPVALTGMLPFLLLPLLGVAQPEVVARAYMSPILFLVVAGTLLGVALEKWQLHRRIALAVVARSRPSAGALLFAVMSVTALLSMWVNNSAATVMMLPIALAVLGALESHETDPEARRRYAAAAVLSVAWGSNIGGFGTIIGTPVNAVAVGLIERELDIQISFLEWMLLGVPLVCIALPCAWWILARRAFAFRIAAASREQICAAIGVPGPWIAPQRRLAAVLAAAALLWVGMPWLQRQLPRIDDSLVAVAAALALCLIPAGRARERLLAWNEAARAPWYLVILLGGGLALADAIVGSGLGAWLGLAMGGIGATPAWLLLPAIVLMTILVTESASNVATASAFMPIVIAVVAPAGHDVLAFALATGMAASWGFANPAGTSSNAMVFATGRITAGQMIRAGLRLDALGAILIALICGTVAPLVTGAD